jgi:hypothetical protein
VELSVSKTTIKEQEGQLNQILPEIMTVKNFTQVYRENHFAHLRSSSGQMNMVFCLQGKRSLGRPELRWENNIKIHLKEIGCEGVDWIHMAQDTDHWRAVVNTVMKRGVP